MDLGVKQIQQWKNGGTLKSSKRLWEHDERCLEESRTEIEHESYTSKKSVPDNRRSRSRGRAARRAVGEERPVSGRREIGELGGGRWRGGQACFSAPTAEPRASPDPARSHLVLKALPVSSSAKQLCEITCHRSDKMR